MQTAHAEKINGLAFPHEFSEVFATCGTGNIRVWHLGTCRELLRIAVPNLECFCIAFSTVSAMPRQAQGDGAALWEVRAGSKKRAEGPPLQRRGKPGLV